MVEPALRASGVWSLLEVVITLDDVEQPKPHPTGYLQGIEALPAHVHPRTIAVEDSCAGIHAAQRAGLPVVGVAGTMPEDELRELADWVVQRLAPTGPLAPTTTLDEANLVAASRETNASN